MRRGKRRELTVHGEAQHNDDGSDRQEIIAGLRPGESVSLIREPHNRYDGNAIRVDSRLGCVGYIARSEAVSMAKALDAGEIWHVSIRYIGGGTPEKPSFGVWLEAFHEPPPRAHKARKARARGLWARLRAFMSGGYR